MKHRILVLGAGYAGAGVAGRLARRLHPEDTEITLVNAEPDFVERIRLHQLAAGQDLPHRALADFFAGTGVRVRLARVTGVDADHGTVALIDAGGGADRLAYDTLVYALGSGWDAQGAPGVAEHAHEIASRRGALRLRERLAGLRAGASVAVVGGGLTGIEAATEIAAARPELDVALATDGEPGDRLGPKARAHLHRAFDRLGIAVHERVAVERVEAAQVVCADGARLPSEATVWSAGFAVHPIAADCGLETAEDGRIVADDTMRSVSHPAIHAVGDSVHVIAEHGRPLPMSCASAGFSARRAAAAIVGDLTGRPVPKSPLRHLGNCIGLGPEDAVFQAVDADLHPRPWLLRGRAAARFKTFVFRGAVWNVARPDGGLPTRRRRLAAAHSGEEAAV